MWKCPVPPADVQSDDPGMVKVIATARAAKYAPVPNVRQYVPAGVSARKRYRPWTSVTPDSTSTQLTASRESVTEMPSAGVPTIVSRTWVETVIRGGPSGRGGE